MKKLFLNLVFLCFLVGYGYYSYGSFRIAKKGFELWNSGNFVTAYKAFQFVLEKNPFGIVIPFSRVFLLDVSQRKKYTEARERLIKGDFEKKLGFFESPKKWTEVFSPFAFDFMPFVLIVLNMLGILSLGAARFFNMVRTDHEGIFEAKYFFSHLYFCVGFFRIPLQIYERKFFPYFQGDFLLESPCHTITQNISFQDIFFIFLPING